MKILSRMLSKKIEPQEPGDQDPDRDQDRELEPFADDTGRENPARKVASPTRVKAKLEEPDVAASGWEAGDWDNDWDDEDDWGDDDLDVDGTADPEKEHLVSEIREAMVSASHVEPERHEPRAPKRPVSDWADDEEFGRRARARSQLTAAADDTEERILEKTEDVMSDRETSRRRSAMAHMKAAAAATKADRVLQHVASSDPSADPEEQSPYRDDLAKVVRPPSTSRPISRQVSASSMATPVWDQGTGDDDAALFAASEDAAETDAVASIEDQLAAEEAARLARMPAALSEEDFASDAGEDRFAVDPPVGSQATADETDGLDEFPASRFAADSFDEDFDDEPGFADDFDDDDPFDADDPDEDDIFAPRPSRAVSEAVAFANAPDEEFDVPEEEVRKKIWEMADEVASEVENARRDAEQVAEEPVTVDEIPADDFNAISTVVPGRAGAGRVKTRLLGFQAEDSQDIFAKSAEAGSASKAAQSAAQPNFPAGWIVVIDGPGRGTFFTLLTGVSQIGRGEDQAVRLDFGDTSISRNNHAAVAYDSEQGKFFLGHGGKSNLVRKNGMPVLSTEELANGDEIRIGETTLKFVSLCGEDFTWSDQGDASAHA